MFSERCLLVAVTGSRNTGPGAEVQKVALSAGPGHEVTGLEVSRTGRWVALWGRDGASVIMMPPRGGLGGRFGGGKEQLVASCRALDTRGETVQGAAWHPGSAAECHLVVLARSGVLSLHNVAELEDTTTVLTCDLGRGEDNKVAAALGEVAVDFCFGSSAGAGGVWPVFVLLASCDVYTVGAGLGAEQWQVEGPLEVRPSLEDNYSDGEGCSLVEVGGVLALATVRGVVYHGILLGGDTAQLRVYERVELGPGAVVTSHEDVFSCPLRLSSCDTVTRPGYLAAHPAGLHAVHLAMVTVLRQAELEADPGLDLAAGSSVVEHLVCTRPSLAAPPAPVLGACLAWPPATLLCLLASNTLTCLGLPPSAAQAAPLLSGAREAEERAGGAPQPRVEAALLALLARRSTQPLLAAAPATELSPALTLELLTSATQTLRREYVARLEVARLELERRVGTIIASKVHNYHSPHCCCQVSELAAKRRDQAGLVARLEAERGRARDKAELLSEKYEDVRDRGQELGHRVEAVLSKLQVSQTV